MLRPIFVLKNIKAALKITDHVTPLSAAPLRFGSVRGTLWLSMVVALFLPALLKAQEHKNEKKADKDYKSYSYSKVIKDLENNKDLTTDMRRELAESYRMLSQYKKAEEVYAIIAISPDRIPEDVFTYAQVLRMNGKYEHAALQMYEYSQLRVNDSRLQEFHENMYYTDELLEDHHQYKIKALAMNTPDEDFGVVYYRDKVVFTSSHHALSKVQRNWNGNGLNFLDLYVATADSLREIHEPVLLSELNKKYHEGPASYNKLGTVTLYTQVNYESTSSNGTRNLQLFESHWQNGKWGKPIPFPMNNKEYSCGHPALTPDGNTLYFSSDMPGGLGGVDIYRTVRLADSTWGKPENLGPNVNTEGNETFPFIHKNGTLFFSSDGHTGLGGLDVFKCKAKGEGFEKPINLGAPVNSTKDDFTFVMDEKERGGYFASNRDGGKGTDDIYSYEILKDVKKVLKGVARDKRGNLLANTSVTIYDHASEWNKSVTTKEDGSYSFEVPDQKDLTVNGIKDAYYDGVTVTNSRGNELVIFADVVLEKEPPPVVKPKPVALKLNPIYFDLDKYNIRADAAAELDRTVKIMKENPGMIIELGSHTDCRAPMQYNVFLSEKRAKSSTDYLVRKGIARNRIHARSYGEMKLKNGCACEGEVKPSCEEDFHQQNRRTEFFIVKTK